VARIMESNTRASDVVGRYGGEEFIIFFPSIQRKAIFNIADKIRKKIEKETRKSIPITVSIHNAKIQISMFRRDMVIKKGYPSWN